MEAGLSYDVEWPAWAIASLPSWHELISKFSVECGGIEMRTVHGMAAAAFFCMALPGYADAICAARTSLTHSWVSDDRGTYYVRQVGNTVWWLGESADSGRTWSNVFKGVRKGDIIDGEWVDVINKGGGGTLRLKVNSRGPTIDGFQKLSSSGTLFGGTKWSWICKDT